MFAILLFGFLTTNASAEVGAIHPKAMPAILADGRSRHMAESAGRRGLEAATAPPDGALRIVAKASAKTAVCSASSPLVRRS
jgi:putative SOS response-associated peptidase YedK